MTRQGQTVRSNTDAGPASYRDLNPTIIHCAGDTCGRSWYGGVTLGAIQVTAADPYQRFFASATLNGLNAWTPPNQLDFVSAYVNLVLFGVGDFTHVEIAPAHNSAVCITGAIDIPAGPASIQLSVMPSYWGNGGGIDGWALQVIEGQTVAQPGCGAAGAPE